jgi:altronate dehydratase
LRDEQAAMSEVGNVLAVFILNADDNVGIATRDLAPNETVRTGPHTLLTASAIPLGHKVALGPIEKGAKVFRCGVPIGSATQAIAQGEHVHVHNLVSNYLPTYTFDGPLRFHERRP